MIVVFGAADKASDDGAVVGSRNAPRPRQTMINNFSAANAFR